jgi:hypothetical protein
MGGLEPLIHRSAAATAQWMAGSGPTMVNKDEFFF